jgi:hypothetical protein
VVSLAAQALKEPGMMATTMLGCIKAAAMRWGLLGASGVP